MWDAAKTTKGLVAIGRRFFWEPGRKRAEKKAGQRRKQSALVDVVAEGGKQWIKVSTVTESRLLFELAKAGWEGDSEAFDSDEETVVNAPRRSIAHSRPGLDVENEVEIVQLACDLEKAAQATYVEYDHPKVVFLFQRLPVDGCAPEITRILAKIMATGAEARCGPIQPPNLSLPNLFRRMVVYESQSLTSTLNIHCTILVALVSDLSHCSSSDLLQRSDAPQYHPVIKRQIAGEEEGSLLPRVLYPILENRCIVCTREAAKRMRDIVSTLGTATEAPRTEIFVGSKEESDGNVIKQQLGLDALKKYSIHATPRLHLPIEVLDCHLSTLSRNLPTAAGEVAPNLSALNKSVFLYGWAENLTTITSNRVVATEIEQKIIEIKKRGGQEQARLKGPRLWVCDIARSLVGKEMGRTVD